MFESLKKYPHVIYEVRKLWGTRQLDSYINDLVVVTDRDHRGGFDPAALEEISTLQDVHRLLYPVAKAIPFAFSP